MKVIYLASPYSHPDEQVRESRYLEAVDACHDIINLGHCPFSPIVHSHPIALRHGSGLGFDSWMKIDFEMICRCDELWILNIEGYDESEGVAKEKQYALIKGLPVSDFFPKRILEEYGY